MVDPTTGYGLYCHHFQLFRVINYMHHYNRWLYWTDYYSSVPKILRVSMDGTSKTILHDADLTAPYGLTIDYDTQTIYWTDYTRNRIERSNANGTSRSVVTTSLVSDPYSITFYDGRLYWTDLNYNRILTVPVNSRTSTYLTSATGDMYGITVITAERQPLGNYKMIHKSCRFILNKFQYKILVEIIVEIVVISVC